MKAKTALVLFSVLVYFISIQAHAQGTRCCVEEWEAFGRIRMSVEDAPQRSQTAEIVNAQRPRIRRVAAHDSAEVRIGGVYDRHRMTLGEH